MELEFMRVSKLSQCHKEKEPVFSIICWNQVEIKQYKNNKEVERKEDRKEERGKEGWERLMGEWDHSTLHACTAMLWGKPVLCTLNICERRNYQKGKGGRGGVGARRELSARRWWLREGRSYYSLAFQDPSCSLLWFEFPHFGWDLSGRLGN